MEKVEPDNLNVKYGGFGRTSWQIRWEGGKLCWRRFAAEWTEVAEEKIQPEEQHWLDFWQALDLSRIWDWNEVYYRAAERSDKEESTPDTEELEVKPDDVISWSVEILLKDGRLVDSSGSNAVPGATRQSRSGRGQRRGQNQKKTAVEVKTTESDSDTTQLDPSNAGIPTDTFDQFLTAVRNLIGGREFADLEESNTPNTLHTQYRTLTPKRKNRPDPFAEEEAASKKKKSSKRSKIGSKGSSSRRKRTTRVGEDGSASKVSRRKKTRRKSRSSGQAQGEKVGTETSEATPRRRKRRRRKRSGAQSSGEGTTPQQKTTSGGPDAKNQTATGDTPTRKKKRRRRRRRKPGGGPGANTGGSSSSGGNTPS
ncbi:MAG: hypothetical protein VYD70_05985 [Planctomycetota bacterium]|nr:hypothetical protein [Planctomycetota bacterium]